MQRLLMAAPPEVADGAPQPETANNAARTNIDFFIFTFYFSLITLHFLFLLTSTH